jgi:hypothetical protein
MEKKCDFFDFGCKITIPNCQNLSVSQKNAKKMHFFSFFCIFYQNCELPSGSERDFSHLSRVPPTSLEMGGAA